MGPRQTGGGILNLGTLTVFDSVFSGNVAGRGGAIFNSGQLSVARTTFAGNSTAAAGGGGAIFSLGSAYVAESAFSGNIARIGGAISSLGGPLAVLNSTFVGNSAFAGGGIHHGTPSPFNVVNSTFKRNSASGVGGGISTTGPGTHTLRNTLVASSPAGDNCAGTLIDGGGNLSWPDSTCPGINVDPRLDPAGLQDNGGLTPTIALLPDSPAIDGGVALGCPPIDQRRIVRPQGAGCDIGAYELVVDATPPVITVPADIVVDATSPSGAVVSYSVSASDEVDGSVPVSCVPPSGSTFPIGTTTVNCTASDAAGNESTASFTVHVKGAPEQVADLVALVDGYGLRTLGTSLQDKLVAVQDLLVADQSQQACEKLGSFLHQVKAQRGKGLTVEQADELTADAQRIKAVIAC